MDADDGRVMNFKKVHIFTQHGNTYTFLNVFNFSYNETAIRFEFTAQSDGKPKRATFFVACIAGFTVME
jgi:hypothetical protein